MSKRKARLVTAVMFTFIVLLCADVVAIWPSALPWVLAVFAVPGAFKFARVTFVWLTTDPEEERDYKFWARRKKTHD